MDQFLAKFHITNQVTDSPYQSAWTISSQQAVNQTESNFILLVYPNYIILVNQLELAWSHRQLSHTWQEYNLHDTCPSESGNFEPGRFRQCLQSSVCLKSTGKVEHALSITFSALIWARNSSKHGTVAIKFGL